MDAIVVYESVYGNTRAVAEAIARGLGGAPVLPVHEAAERREPADLLVLGGPTHLRGLATTRSRMVGAEASDRDHEVHVEPDALAQPGLRSWLGELSPAVARHAAVFDTRLDKSPWMTGSAARRATQRLRRRGIEVVATQSFLVEGTEGPLEPGELDRAREWGAELARSLHAAAA